MVVSNVCITGNDVELFVLKNVGYLENVGNLCVRTHLTQLFLIHYKCKLKMKTAFAKTFNRVYNTDFVKTSVVLVSMVVSGSV